MKYFLKNPKYKKVIMPLLVLIFLQMLFLAVSDILVVSFSLETAGVTVIF